MKLNRIPTTVFWLIFLPLLGAIIWFIWSVFVSWPSAENRMRNTESSTGTNQEHDPFSEAANQEPIEDAKTKIKIKTLFVSVGSGTEELNFDWIVAPFQPTTEQAAHGQPATRSLSK